jgi:ribosome-binding protein aMBF1 (putative translation factor)
MKIKLSATFEGKCDLCGKKTKVFSLGDEDSKKVLTICEDCSKKLGEMQASDAIEKYGHKDEKPFEKGVRLEKSTAS